MKSDQSKTADELRMSAKEFDRIMGQALQVKPVDSKAPKAKATPKQTGKSK